MRYEPTPAIADGRLHPKWGAPPQIGSPARLLHSSPMDRPGDRPLHVRRRLILLGCGIVAFGATRLLAAFPGLVETVYANGPAPLAVALLSRASGWVPVTIS